MIGPQRDGFSKQMAKTSVMHGLQDVPACNQDIEVQAIPGPKSCINADSLPHDDGSRY